MIFTGKSFWNVSLKYDRWEPRETESENRQIDKANANKESEEKNQLNISFDTSTREILTLLRIKKEKKKLTSNRRRCSLREPSFTRNKHLFFAFISSLFVFYLHQNLFVCVHHNVKMILPSVIGQRRLGCVGRGG